MTKGFFLLTLFLILFLNLNAQSVITGNVTDSKGDKIAYASVYVKPSFAGTTTNTEGYYKLETTPGKHTLICQYLGYKLFKKEIELSTTPLKIDIRLEPESFALNEVVIKEGAEDPAYPIIRKTIAKRKYYLHEVDGYTCGVYIKGLQKLTKYPEKFMGQVVDFGGLVDSTTGIFYLSESVSEFSFRQPDKIKEEMISSRISGNSRAFSYNKASDMLFNFYENRLMAEGVSAKGFVSPIASDALFYYRYKLLGSVIENDRLIHKIEVTPKRNADPVFRGVIYIADDLWRLQNVDLYLTRDAGIEFIDTLRVRQTFVPVSNTVWMTSTNRFDFSFRILGFVGGGNYVGYFSDYKINPDFARRTFTSEILRINNDANKMNVAYWDSVRPIPLTVDEEDDYRKKDSLQMIRESKHYLDSIDKRVNKFSVQNFFLLGYTYQRSYNKMTYSIKPIFNTIAYNTVEGWNVALNTDYTKYFENKKRIDADGEVRYGLSNKHWNANASFRYLFNRFNESSIKVQGGTTVIQLNSENPISPLVNSLYTLWGEKNYMKLYEKQFGKVEYGKEWFNGFNADISAEYGRRNALNNTSETHWKDYKNLSYTSNNPLLPGENTLLFEPHNYALMTLDMTYSPGVKFITRPDRKIRQESAWPKFNVTLRKAFPNLLQSKTDFLSFAAGMRHQIDFGMLGYLDYRGDFFTFIDKKQVYFPDNFHFNGNLTWFTNFNLSTFGYLDYYAYSTVNNASALHAEYHLNRFITNKIPYFRKLKLNEIVGFHFLHVKGLPEHYELTIGLEKFGIARVDFVQSYSGRSKPWFSFRCGLMIIGRQ
ncbi:MAG: carboxypeptidase-like regulatory domain-containing protein [Bacteroidetes bacterium]|jgi:hypothetical protein|nr:carboxypeptidase-like regulatory domain-containing protein [Bacteroidota bacterium]